MELDSEIYRVLYDLQEEENNSIICKEGNNTDSGFKIRVKVIVIKTRIFNIYFSVINTYLID